MASVLWLHDMGDPKNLRSAVESLETMLLRHAQGHDVRVVDARLTSEDLYSVKWDAIFLGPTFLCNRYSASRLGDVEARFGWVADSPALKVALPQDDYDCSELLDEWLQRWNISVCYSALAGYAQILYPRFSATGEVRPAFTGYVDPRWIHASENAPIHDQRSVDVFYRASRLPANFGSLGQLKSEIADQFTRLVPDVDSSIRMDISCSPDDVVSGAAWHKRLSNSRFTLACPSGSSLLDPRGLFRECVECLPTELPFATISQRCFPGQDNLHSFEAIAPRHIEAALWGTVQIAIEGNYSGILDPDVHYLVLERDFSNLEEVVAEMHDARAVAAVRQTARRRVLGVPQLRLENFAAELLSMIPAHRRRIPDAHEELPSLTKPAFQSVYDSKSMRYWRRRRRWLAAVRVIDRVGMGRIARWARNLLRKPV